jgi:tRNA1(Val) A37 N6-methylase TrmN6
LEQEFSVCCKDLGIKSNITAFEINETTAKIAKFFIPKPTSIFVPLKPNLLMKRQQKEFSEKYDLVIGNPPYGDHRGFTKVWVKNPKSPNTRIILSKGL